LHGQSSLYPEPKKPNGYAVGIGFLMRTACG